MAAACLLVGAAACGRAMFVPPKGPGTPLTDASTVWDQATRSCRGATTYKAALRVSGRAGTQRIPPLSIETAVTSDSSIYMGATAAGRSVFILAGNARQATLWLQRDERVVVAPAAEIVDAILGVSLPPERLLAILTGCVTRSFDVKSSEQFGKLAEVVTPDARVFLAQEAAGWRTRAAEVDGFFVELVRETSSLPQKVFINTPVGREPKADVDVTASEAEMNGTIPVTFFSPPAGAKSAQPMTIGELRAAGAWKDRGTSPR
jgi:hypothetical protein